MNEEGKDGSRQHKQRPRTPQIVETQESCICWGAVVLISKVYRKERGGMNMEEKMKEDI